ncbi:MAG: hypothetical protein AB1861_01845 [Cyanobacteriota bacterium]
MTELASVTYIITARQQPTKKPWLAAVENIPMSLKLSDTAPLLGKIARCNDSKGLKNSAASNGYPSQAAHECDRLGW